MSEVYSNLYYYYYYYYYDGYLYALMGGTTSLWTATETNPASVTMMGEYYAGDVPHIWNTEIYSYNYITGGSTTYDNPDTPDSESGAYYGYIGGIDLPSAVSGQRSLEGRLVALYIDPPDADGVSRAGILKGSLTSKAYPDINMFEMDGGIYPTQVVSSIGITPDNLNYSILYEFTPGIGSGTFTGGESITFQSVSLQMMNIENQNWGIENMMAYRAFNGSTSDTWSASINADAYNSINRIEVSGMQWSNNKLAGSTVGYRADISSTPSTGISVGETLGTFNPIDYTTGTWQAVQMGVWLETNKFLEMVNDVSGAGKAVLQALNIPCVEVGRATLTGSGNNFTNLQMTDTTFFAYSSGAAPKIWATGSVTGTYTAPPALSTSIQLSGGPLNANFDFKAWDSASGKWLSTINGTGGYNGSTSFQGAGAGTGATATSGTISGTGAGVVK